MRTVLNKVVRSVTATTAAALMTSRESTIVGNHQPVGSAPAYGITTSFGSRRSFPIDNQPKSLSPKYNLNAAEEQTFEELLDKECDYYPDNSRRGDCRILNMRTEQPSADQNVNSGDVMALLRVIRFANSVVFEQNPVVFLTAANYIQRLLNKKAVKKDLMPFITAAVYDIAIEFQTGTSLNNRQIGLLLTLCNVPLAHIEDFSRMRQLLLGQLGGDLRAIVMTDYLQVLLRMDDPMSAWTSLLDPHRQLVDAACVLASGCELTHFTLACQAISLINLAARHVSIHQQQHLIESHAERLPLIFVSPVRLTQFARIANVTDDAVGQCAEAIVRFYAAYYAARPSRGRPIKPTRMISVGPSDQQLLQPIREEELEHSIVLSGHQLVVDRRQQRRLKRRIWRQLKVVAQTNKKEIMALADGGGFVGGRSLVGAVSQ